jgi:hypothetical protein
MGFLDKRAARFLMRDDYEISLSNSLNMNGGSIRKLRGIKEKDDEVVMTSLAQTVSKVARNRERRLLNKGELSPLRGKSLNAREHIRKLRTTCTSMQPELLKSARQAGHINLNGGLAALVDNHAYVLNIAS